MLAAELTALLHLNKVKIHVGSDSYYILDNDHKFTLSLESYSAGFFRTKYILTDIKSKTTLSEDTDSLKALYDTITKWLSTSAEDQASLTKEAIRKAVDVELNRIIYPRSSD